MVKITNIQFDYNKQTIKQSNKQKQTKNKAKTKQTQKNKPLCQTCCHSVPAILNNFSKHRISSWIFKTFRVACSEKGVLPKSFEIIFLTKEIVPGKEKVQCNLPECMRYVLQGYFGVAQMKAR